MKPVAGVLVYMIINRVGIEIQINHFITFNAPLSTEKALESSDEVNSTDQILEDVIFGFCVAIAFVIVIGLIESEIKPLKNTLPVQKHVKNRPKTIQTPKLLQELNGGNAKLMKRTNISQVYEMYNSFGDIVSIFKPYSRITSYKGDLILSQKRHIINEVAAFKFDQLSKGSAGVPETRHVKIQGHMFNSDTPITGCLQKYVSNTTDCEDLGSSLFKVDDVHRIGVLDLKILNCDRHSGNLLYKKEEKTLIPIDHALSFPEVGLIEDKREKMEKKLTLGDISFDWLMYKQSKVKFSEEMLKEISEIDVEEYVNVMKELKMSYNQQMGVVCSLVLLKVGALEFGKSLYDIGSIVQRKGMRREKSEFEILVEETERNVGKKEMNEIKEAFERKVREYLSVSV